MFFQSRPWNGNALSAGATIDAEHQAQARQVAAAQEAYDLSYARYTGGIDSFLNVLDAQRMLYGAQQRLVEIEKRRLANLINLYKVNMSWSPTLGAQGCGNLRLIIPTGGRPCSIMALMYTQRDPIM